MEVRQLKHFIAIAETGSFTRASERVALSQPALSASIAKLEADLGVQLLIRNRTKVLLTNAGHRLLQEAQVIVGTWSKLKNSVRQGQASPPLRIGIHWTVPSRHMARLIRKLQETDPAINVDLTDGNQEYLITQLQSGTFHGIILGEDSDAKTSGFNPIFRDQFMISAPYTHRFARQSVVALSELREEPLILCRSCEKYPEIIKALSRNDINPRFVYTTDQAEGALNLVSAGVGVAIVPGTFNIPSIEMIPLQDLDITRTVGLQWVSRQAHEHLETFYQAALQYDWTGQTIEDLQIVK